MRKFLLGLGLLLVTSTAIPEDLYRPFEEKFPVINSIRTAQIAELKAKPKTKPTPKLKVGVVTVYANKFEGRRMASGVRFSHAKSYVASRCFKFGTKIRMHYGRASATVTVMDRGGLPLHRPDRIQFDLPKKVAKELGLYKVVRGKTDRTIRYEVIK